MDNTYTTGKPCKRGHISPRYKSNNACIACEKERQQNLTSEQKTEQSLRARRWEANNPEKVKQYRAAYLNKNRQEIYARQKARNKANPELHKQYIRTHKTRFKAHYTAKSRAYEITKKNAMPPWADAKLIETIYAQADYISRLTGIPHQVDHIVPLQNSRVCGLHVPWNLQILDATTNRRKSNYFEGSR